MNTKNFEHSNFESKTSKYFTFRTLKMENTCAASLILKTKTKEEQRFKAFSTKPRD